MVEPEKPFACGIPDCGMTFTNEDHLHVHTKKHDMMLLGLEQKVFVADQTPTPTRFIRNCEDLGIFQDLQNVNPFDEGFKQAMETAKHGMLSLENSTAVESLRCHQTPEGDVLHTPQFIDPRDSALYTSNHRNITISRSSSDESGVIKGYETTTISKLTNEVTTISRVVNKHDVIDKILVNDDVNDPKTNEHVKNDVHNETSVSYTNNVIKIHNNIEIRKDNLNAEAKTVPVSILSYDKDAHSIITKDVLLTDSSKDTLPIPPIMSQKSFDFVVDRLTSDLCKNEIKKPAVKAKPRKCAKPLPKAPPMFNEVNNTPENKNDAPKTDDYEVIIKLPDGKQVRMKSVEEINTEYNTIEKDTKEKLKLAINNKAQRNTLLQKVPSINTLPGILPYSTGTLIPVTIVNSNSNLVQKIPIVPFNTLLKSNQELKKTVKRKTERNKVINVKKKSTNEINRELDDDCVIVNEASKSKGKKRTEEDMNSRVAASRRYRMRLRESMRRQEEEIQQLRDSNQRLVFEKATLQLLITEHLKTCPDADNLRDTQAKLHASSNV